MLSDLRYAVRSFLKNPAFSVACILTLALGIGANTAIFSVVDAVLLRKAPFTDINRLVMVWETDRNTGTTREPASLPDYLDIKERARTPGAGRRADGRRDEPDAGGRRSPPRARASGDAWVAADAWSAAGCGTHLRRSRRPAGRSAAAS